MAKLIERLDVLQHLNSCGGIAHDVLSVSSSFKACGGSLSSRSKLSISLPGSLAETV